MPPKSPAVPGEDEYWELWKRVVNSLKGGQQYSDPTGRPSLTSRQLIKPQKFSLPTSNAKTWVKKTFGRAMYVWTKDFRTIYYFPADHPGDLSGDPSQPFNISTAGYAYLNVPGDWYLCTPVLAGDTAEGNMAGLYGDAFLGTQGIPADASGIIGAPPPAGSENIAQIGGTPQSAGLDLAKVLKSLTLGAPASVTVGAADVLVLAANANRRGVVLYNQSTAGQVIAIGTRNPMTGLSDGIVQLEAGALAYFGPMDFFTTAALRGWASAAGGSIRVTEGT
jgi:hypothetical protein